MSSVKKITAVFDDQANANIQRKFDLVFNDTSRSEASAIFNDNLEFDTGLEEEFVMERNGKNGGDSGDSKDGAEDINLDFSLDEDTSEIPEFEAVSAAAAPAAASKSGPSGMELSDDGLDFSLNFDMDAAVETQSKPTISTADISDDSGGFTLDDSDIGSNDFDESTKKTVMVNVNNLTNSNLAEFSLEKSGSHNFSADHMSTEEAKANIESTIKDILRPKFDDTKEIDINEMKGTGLSDIEDSELSFRENTPSKGFVLEDAMDDDAFSLDNTPAASTPKAPADKGLDSTGDFDITELESAPVSINDSIEEFGFEASAPEAVVASTPAPEVPRPAQTFEAQPSMGLGGSSVTTEDGIRFQATIRALREEREEMLAQIKHLKSDSKELEQDNLTLKANLDEAKIEITILRKRQMVELEDIKYRLALSDEKKAMADEKARQADMRREKLEQKVRIDFNQVKQREKELEGKLELLSMDVDSQVQSRDHKILELRRKIDALEFNMENASIKEQKSLEDKRKLEDRLNKIMKTLRHSIKNLEDDIDHASEDDDHQKEKN